MRGGCRFMFLLDAFCPSKIITIFAPMSQPFDGIVRCAGVASATPHFCKCCQIVVKKKLYKNINLLLYNHLGYINTMFPNLNSRSSRGEATETDDQVSSVFLRPIRSVEKRCKPSLFRDRNRNGSLFTAPPLIPIYRNDRSNMSYLIDCKFFIKHTRLISISFHPDSLENHPQ